VQRGEVNMGTMTTRETERLALLKYLFGVGFSQTSQPAPLSAVGLLQLHDTVELFLVLAAEHLNVTPGRRDLPFLEYWKELRPALAGADLPEFGLMKRLNQARVSLKHHGLQPDERDLRDFADGVGRFLTDATPMVFGIDFETVSLIDFVQSIEAREQLRQAQAALSAKEVVRGLEACAVAFDALVADFEKRARDERHGSPFQVGESMGLHTSSRMHLPNSGPVHELARFVDAAAESIEALQQAVRILLLGLDYRRYARFRGLTPLVYHTFAGPQPHLAGSDELAGCSERDLEFCIGFVFESALRLQEFVLEPPAWASWHAFLRR
jgi:hypothetical protein